MSSEAKHDPQQGKAVEQGIAGNTGASVGSGALSPLVTQWMAANHRLDAAAFASLFPMQKAQRDEILAYLHANFGNGFVVNGISKGVALVTTHQDLDASPAKAPPKAESAPPSEQPSAGWDLAGAVMFGPTMGAIHPSKRAVAASAIGVAMGPTAGNVTLKETEAYGHRSVASELMMEDVRGSIEQCPDFAGDILDPIWEDFKVHWIQYAQMTASMVAIEVAIAALAVVPDPSMATKAIALLLQALVFVLAVEASVSASDDVVEHGTKWWNLATTAHNFVGAARVGMRAEASRELARMLVKSFAAIVAVSGGITTSLGGVKFAGRDSVLEPSTMGGSGESRSGAGPGSPSARDRVPGSNSESTSTTSADHAATQVEPGANKPSASSHVSSQPASDHVHLGDVETDPQSPYFGKWNGDGLHDWEGLLAVCKRDGYKIKSVTQDPVSGVRRVTIERVGAHPKTGAPSTGKIQKTFYPKDLAPEEMDSAAQSALAAAERGDAETKFRAVDPSRTRRNGLPVDGSFEAVVRIGQPPRDLRIQGWFKEDVPGMKTITSHAPAFKETWPSVNSQEY